MLPARSLACRLFTWHAVRVQYHSVRLTSVCDVMCQHCSVRRVLTLKLCYCACTHSSICVAICHNQVQHRGLRETSQGDIDAVRFTFVTALHVTTYTCLL
jgi:hypothetical protein